MMENTAYLYALQNNIRMIKLRKVIWAADVVYTTEERKVFVSTILNT
jgi:hypothetical protein